MAQKTDFAFEVLINDDASTDATQNIIEEFQKRYPGVVKPVFQKENQYSQGKRNFIARYLLPRAKGAYLALCEGDDFWTDPDKLQKQVDFLEKNKDYALCFHPVRVFFEDDKSNTYNYPDESIATSFNLEGLLRVNFIQTNSVVYRKQKYHGISNDVMPNDWYLHLYHAQFGKIGYIDTVMSAYRKHKGGIWWDFHENQEKIWRIHGLAHLRFYAEIVKLYGNDPAYRAILFTSAGNLFKTLLDIDKKYGDALAVQAMTEMPVFVEELIAEQYVMLGKAQEEAEDAGKLKMKLNDLTETLSKIHSSRLWIMRNRLAKLLGKEVL